MSNESIAAVQSRMQELRALVAPASPSRTAATSTATTATSGGTAAAFQTALAEASGAPGTAAVTGSAGAPAVSKASPTGGATGTGIAPETDVTAQDLIATAKKYLGVPYVWGGESLSEGGLDCSGLVLRSLTDLGVDGVPRTARQQMHIGTKVASMAAAKPGDLLVFGGGTHIAIYLGGGKMIDAPKPGGHVNIRDVYTTPTAIRRILPQEGATAAAAPVAPAVPAAAASLGAEVTSLAGMLGAGTTSSSAIEGLGSLASSSGLAGLSSLAGLVAAPGTAAPAASSTDASRLVWELLAGVAS